MRPVQPISYPQQKFAKAVRELATGVGTLRPRLCEAYIKISPLTPSDLPLELRDAVDEIKRCLTQKKTDKYEQSLSPRERQLVGGPLCATLRGMRKDKMKEIAERICYVAEA